MEKKSGSLMLPIVGSIILAVVITAFSQEQTASSHEVAEASDKLASNAQDLQEFVSKFSL